MQQQRKNTITVTAIVSTYNRASFVRQALDSLLAQSRPVDELIVVDDASNDGTERVVQEYGDKIRYLRNTRNAGKSASLNFAIPRASGSHIWIFDDDDIALPDALAGHVAYLHANPQIDFSYSDKYVFQGDGDIWQRDQWRIQSLPTIAPDDFFERTLYTMNTLFQGMLVPARCYRQLAGPFDETLDRCIDHELLLRLSRRFRAGNIGYPTYVYREHGGLRGSADHRHGAHERYRVMLGYRQAVFLRLRHRLALQDFTPRACKLAHLASSNDTLALLQRACVLLHHGLVEEALADLHAALPALRPADLHQSALTAVLARATHIEPWIWPRGAVDMAHLAKTLAATDTLDLSSAFARGLYWQARGEAAGHDFRACLDALCLLAVFSAFCLWQRAFGRIGLRHGSDPGARLP